MSKYKLIRAFALMWIIFAFSTPLNAAVVRTDFNGDRKADLFVGNIFSGQMFAWLSNGTTIASRPSYGTLPPNSGWATIGMKNANADGRTDLYWYNSNSGAIATQLVNGATVSPMVNYGSKLRSQGWAPIGLGDYNGDRRFDVFWFNIYSGSVEVWTVNGTTALQKLALGTLPPNQGWVPIGLRDLNFDGRTDVFLYNPYTGGTGAWLIGISTVVYGQVAPSQGWQPIALEDFNGDGKADLLWHNIRTGNISAWLINGGVVISSVALGILPPSSGWILAGLNDLNGDSKTDIFWYNVNSGGTGTWLIGNGTGFLPIGTLPAIAGWRPIGLDDFNGDHKADLIWVNAFTNATATWLLDGGKIIANVAYGPMKANSVWTINVQQR
ncbi:MAG: VCBS repeat-containing protein [Methylococcales bacterium]|nr:VCBS repeat-containing protein [Methylococcales bacterium]